ncbi:MAG: mandelate racemase/muconate lactonizing enzyme family protein [Gaiella sp.]
MSVCPIASIEAIALEAPTVDPEDLDSSAETLVVRIVDEEGRVGIGEADAPAVVVRELVRMPHVHAWSRGLAATLLGRDPVLAASLTDELYAATVYHGRRGLGVHALSAVDIALHDLAGKQLGRPAFHLLGGPRRDAITPYATIYPGAARDRTIGELMDAIAAAFEHALKAGFRAVKMEVLFGELVSDRELAGCIREGRALLGDEVALLVDFGYRWRDWREARWVLDRVADCDLYLAEGALRHDDLAGHRRLARATETRIGGAELAATVWECREWIREGEVDVLQPDVGRCGGLTELRRIAEMADLEGVLVIPHAWKTGITAAASRHFQAATPNAPYVEHFHPDQFLSPLRAGLVTPEPELVDGCFALPTAPGLGIELCDDLVERYRVA